MMQVLIDENMMQENYQLAQKSQQPAYIPRNNSMIPEIFQ